MRYIDFIYYNDGYNYNGSSDGSITVLGSFLISDIDWHGISSIRNWTLNSQYTELETNITILEKQDDYIILTDLFPQEGYDLAVCQVPIGQFLQLLNRWEDACKSMPKQISIIYKNSQFIMQVGMKERMCCPVCEKQGYVYKAKVLNLEIIIQICDKCKVSWSENQRVEIKNFKKLSDFLKEHSLKYDDAKIETLKYVIAED